MTEDDARLVALARSGHADAFEQLVRRHQISAYRVALRLLGDPGEAEDAVQDAFLQVWRNLKRFRSSSSFATWLYRIVTNRCLNLLRSRRWSAQLVEDHTLTAQAGPAEIAEARGKLAVLKLALLRLTPEQRDSVRGLLAEQRQQSQALREQTDAKIRALLNADQQKKFDTMLTEQKERRARKGQSA